MANQGRWQEQDRYGRGREGGRQGDDYGRDFGAPYRGRGYERDEDSGGRPAESYGSGNYNAVNSYGSNYGGDRFGGERFDRPRGGEGYRTDSGWQRDSAFDRDQWASRSTRQDRDAGRGWWDRATDEVSSWFGDHDAERRRHADEMQGHRGRGPKGYTRTDERIREEVCDRLSDDPYVDASEIEVSVAGGEVTLSGTASSREERRRAEDCAERVSGVNHVQNNVRVNARSSNGYGDNRSSYAENPGTSGDGGRAVTSSSAVSGRSGVGISAPASDPYSRGTSTGATGGNPAIDVSGQR